MDYINSHLSQKQQIHKIIESQYFTSHKESTEKDIFRIGKKGVKIIANKEFDNKGNFKDYSLLKLSIKPHYYHNNDLHNGDYFTANESIEVLNDIAQKLNISNMNLLKITSFDFGINMIPDEQDTKDIVNQKPEFRILAFLNAHKNPDCPKKELVEFTRQEIANFTGLRVETVIRELSKMSKTNKVEIINHKLYY